MKKLYYLSTCSTCKRIMKDLGDLISDFDIQDIKSEPISPEDLDEMKLRSGSYESLFSRKAIKFRSMGLREKELTEGDYRKFIIEEYTFLKRPVFVVGERIFIGNAPKIIDQLKSALK